MKLFKDVDNHIVIIEIERGEIENINCDCKWGTLHQDAWKEGNSICKHIKSIIKEKI